MCSFQSSWDSILAIHIVSILGGPYSSALADDYYKLAGHYSSYRGDYTKTSESLDTEKFLEVIEGKDAKWLEIASTILSVYDRHRKKFYGAELKKIRYIYILQYKEYY